MKVLVSGSTGLIGSAVVDRLKREGHSVTRLVRTASHANDGAVTWDIRAGTIDRRGLEGHDAVVHLAGEPLTDGRWTEKKKMRIRDSRVKGTQLLSEALSGLARPPKVLCCASAIGFYGNRGDEQLDENSAAGSGFLAEVCQAWEAAAEPAREGDIRVVHTRFGVVLAANGGALAKMLPAFKMGGGGVIGGGDQYMSWIAIDDAVSAILHVLQIEELSGPVNTVSPNPVTNREFTKALGRVLKRPTIVRVPRMALRAAFGEMADEALLASDRALPTRLINTGFEFDLPDLEPALRHVLGRP